MFFFQVVIQMIRADTYKRTNGGLFVKFAYSTWVANVESFSPKSYNWFNVHCVPIAWVLVNNAKLIKFS